MKPLTPEQNIENAIPAYVGSVTPSSSIGSTSGNIEDFTEVDSKISNRRPTRKKIFKLRLAA